MGRKHIGSADLADWVRKQKETPGEEKRTVVEERQRREEEKEKASPEKKVEEETKKGVEKAPLDLDKTKVEAISSPLGPELPDGVYAHFLLIDIAPPIKYVRGIPQYLEVKQTRTLIGSYVNAHVRLDDQNTVALKHAKLIYEERDRKREFVIYPIDPARVSVNGEVVPSEGMVLKSGDRVKIGSADLILFLKELKED
jgi:sulfur carrier protein ThiS